MSSSSFYHHHEGLYSLTTEEAHTLGVKDIAMKVLIGITQGLEQTRDFITREFRETGSATETGPFLSREEAFRWEQFMIERAEGCELLSLPQQPPEDSLWYGITLEWDQQ